MHDLIRVVKVQAAYYEMYGLPGITAFSETLRLARELGYIAIADCKRNDIGATAGAYAKAYLLARGRIFLRLCHSESLPRRGRHQARLPELAGEYGRGLYVLVKTSNPSGVELQDQALADGRKVYELMADLVSHWGSGLIGSCGYSAVGAVVGATWPAESTALRAGCRTLPFWCRATAHRAPPAETSPDALTRTGAERWSTPPARCSARTRNRPELGWLEATRAEAVRMREDITAGFRKGADE